MVYLVRRFILRKIHFGFLHNYMVHITEIRVRYAETDRMKRVYHGAFVTYLEVARVECLRSVGWPYRQMEENGILLPVTSAKLNFHLPVEYDELLRIETQVTSPPTARILFDYRIINEAGQVAVTAETELVFIEASSGRPCKAPKELIAALGY